MILTLKINALCWAQATKWCQELAQQFSTGSGGLSPVRIGFHFGSRPLEMTLPI